jgi:hypothetical protein
MFSVLFRGTQLLVCSFFLIVLSSLFVSPTYQHNDRYDNIDTTPQRG